MDEAYSMQSVAAATKHSSSPLGSCPNEALIGELLRRASQIQYAESAFSDADAQRIFEAQGLIFNRPGTGGTPGAPADPNAPHPFRDALLAALKQSWGALAPKLLPALLNMFLGSLGGVAGAPIAATSTGRVDTTQLGGGHDPGNPNPPKTDPNHPDNKSTAQSHRRTTTTEPETTDNNKDLGDGLDPDANLTE